MSDLTAFFFFVFTLVEVAGVCNDLGLKVKQTVLFAPLALLVSISATIPKAQQHGLAVI